MSGPGNGKKLHEFLKGKGHGELSNARVPCTPAAPRRAARDPSAVTRSYRNSRWFYALCDTRNIARRPRGIYGGGQAAARTARHGDKTFAPGTLDGTPGRYWIKRLEKRGKEITTSAGERAASRFFSRRPSCKTFRAILASPATRMEQIKAVENALSNSSFSPPPPPPPATTIDYTQ